jgi:hypothetical protein
MHIIINVPSWTDIIQAFAAMIAVPGAIAGFVVLFKRDKDKENQIKKLAEIATRFDAQNIIMQEGNKLLGEQVEVLRSMVTSQMEATEGAKRLADIEEEKHLLNMRPRLFSNGGMLRDDSVQFFIENHGETAFIKGVTDLIEPKQLLITTSFPQSLEIDKNKHFIISTKTINGQHWNTQPINHRFEIQYTDRVGNLYQQETYGIVGKKYHISDPALIKRAAI